MSIAGSINKLWEFEKKLLMKDISYWRAFCTLFMLAVLAFMLAVIYYDRLPW